MFNASTLIKYRNINQGKNCKNIQNRMTYILAISNAAGDVTQSVPAVECQLFCLITKSTVNIETVQLQMVAGQRIPL